MNFFQKNKNKIIILSVTLVLIILMGFTSGNREYISNIENITGTFFRPVNSLIYKIASKNFSIFDSLRTNSSLKKENEKLKTQLAEVEKEKEILESVVARKEYLKLEYDLKSKSDYKLQSANIIAKEPSNMFERFVINKGLDDGIKNGDTIVQGTKDEKGTIIEGVVGRVVEVGNTTAKIVSIVDETSKIGFKVNKTQDGGVISGIVDEKLSGYLFDIDSDIKKGDAIYTSGLGGVFEPDLYIGKVSEVIKKDEELTKTVLVEPSIDFKKLNRVFIIIE